MDADDLALPHWLEAVLGRIRRLAGGSRRHRDDRPRRRRRARRRASHADRASRGALGVPVLVAVLPFDGRRRPCSSSASGFATTPRSARARTTTSGRGSSPLLMETTLGTRSLYRKHEAQASARRATLQRECQRRSRCVRSARSCRRSTRRAPSWPGPRCRGCPCLRARPVRRRRRSPSSQWRSTGATAGAMAGAGGVVARALARRCR